MAAVQQQQQAAALPTAEVRVSGVGVGLGDRLRRSPQGLASRGTVMGAEFQQVRCRDIHGRWVGRRLAPKRRSGASRSMLLHTRPLTVCFAPHCPPYLAAQDMNGGRDERPKPPLPKKCVIAGAASRSPAGLCGTALHKHTQQTPRRSSPPPSAGPVSCMLRGRCAADLRVPARPPISSARCRATTAAGALWSTPFSAPSPTTMPLPRRRSRCVVLFLAFPIPFEL